MGGNMLLFVFALMLVLALANAGSVCPEREMLYPCHCTNVQLTKKNMFTVVTCRHVPQTDSFSRIFMVFRSMQIDRFVIYDSFWESENDSQRKLPENWLTNLHIVELEIMDTILSNDFACDIKSTCQNNALRELTIRNSSISDVSACRDGKRIFFWTSCLNKMQHFRLINNQMKKIDKLLFPTVMSDLLTVNLSRNDVEKIANDSFENLVKMHSLDLSHNRISYLPGGIFGNKGNALTYLDVSWNSIKSLSSGMFKLMPYLVTFMASNNQLEQLPESDWVHLPEKIRLIDLQDNPIVCDCHMMWINCSLHINTVMLGRCSNENFTETPLRRASVYMLERCDEKGILQNRQDKQKLNTCESLRNKHMSNHLAPGSIMSARPTTLPEKSQMIGRRNRQTRLSSSANDQLN